MSHKSLGGRMSAVLAALGLVGLALLPPEHVHDQDDHGHHSELVHRHFEAHHQLGDQTHVDDDADADAHYLTAVFTVTELSFHAGPAGDVVVGEVEVPLSTPVSRVVLDSPAALGHDPPWRSSLGLRAPPTPLV